MNLKRTSKFLSLILRHQPDLIQLELDPQGWADVDELILKSKGKLPNLDRQLLETVVAENDKKRFTFSADGKRIRANQGHSIDIELGLEPVVPPEFLFHGTADRFIPSIRAKGLIPGSRQHVHLSVDEETALKVGSRHGKPVILTIPALEMHGQGFQFMVSKNGVWLTDHVPASWINFS